LRNHGVTLHLQLKGERHPVPDVPAIYFVEPTEENILRIVSDYKAGMYSYMHLNFSSSISDSLLQRFGREIAAIQPAPRSQVTRVIDRYCSFISLDQTTYSLNHQSTYYNLHRSGISDREIEALIERSSLSLLSVILTTIKQVPVIRAASNGPAAMVAQNLHDKLVALVNSPAGPHLFSSTAAVSADPSHAQRPLLIILDRDLDLTPMVAHAWSYAGLCSDLLGMELNKLSIPKENKHYDIDQSESFWKNNAHLPFPEAATAVNELVNEFSRIRVQVTADDSGLTSAVSALPQVTEMKRTVDMHTTIATSLLNEVKARQIDRYFELERDANLNGLMQLLAEPGTGPQIMDRIRTAMFIILRKENFPASKIDQIISQFVSSDSPVNALKYVKYLVGLRAVAASPPSASVSPQVVLPGMLEKMRTRGEGLLAAGMKNLKNILPVNENFVVTNTVQQVADQTVNALTESFLYFDPKNANSSVRVRGSFRQVLVCVVGGGCVLEAENVHAWALKTGRTVVYGASDFPNPTWFVNDLAKLS
jgi:hypothetical protein